MSDTKTYEIGRTDMVQVAPYPVHLKNIIDHLKLTTKPNWSFRLYDDYPRDTRDDGEGDRVIGYGMTLIIKIDEIDAYHGEVEHRVVNHLFIVPAATYDYVSWRRWVFDRIMDVQTHEMMEGFEVNGEHPYAPNHGPGRSPYTIFEYATDEQRRTQFTGAVKEPEA